MRTEPTAITIHREKLKFLIYSEVKSAIEAPQSYNIGGLIENTICDIIITENYATTDCIKDTSIPFDGNLIMKII